MIRVHHIRRDFRVIVTFIIWLILPVFLLVACDNATPTPDPTATSTQAPTQEATSPTSTPMQTENLPALELLSGYAETCSITESYSVVLGFNAMHYEITSTNHVKLRLLAEDGSVIMEDESSTENKDGEEGWGFYPVAYDVPDNTALTIEVTVFDGADDDAQQTSFSSLTYDCTTGETITSAFERR